MGRKLIWGLIAILILGLPAGSLAQVPSINSDQRIAQIKQVSTQAVSRIKFLLYHKENITEAATEIGETRTKAIRVITELVNDFKAKYTPYLESRGKEGDDLLKSQAKVAIYNVEFAGQQAVDAIELATKQTTSQKKPASPLPVRAELPYLRTSLPTRYDRYVYNRQNESIPPVTANYARAGNRPFLPLSPTLGRAVYPYREIFYEPRPRSLWETAGLAIGGFLGTQYFLRQKATIRVTKFSPHDEQNYVLTMTSLKTNLERVAVPQFLEDTLRLEVEPGKYKVFYKPTSELSKLENEQQYAYYPLVILPGETWCFQVPRPPVRCY